MSPSDTKDTIKELLKEQREIFNELHTHKELQSGLGGSRNSQGEYVPKDLRQEKLVATDEAEQHSASNRGEGKAQSENLGNALSSERSYGRREFDDFIPGQADVKYGELQAKSTDIIVSEKSDKKGKKRVPLGQKLIELNLITQDQLEIALKIQRQSTESKLIGKILVELGLITENTLLEILAEERGVEVFEIKKAIIDPSLIKQVPKDIASRYKAIPVNMEEGSITVAMSDTYNVLAIDQIKRFFPKQFHINPVHASERDIMELINNYYDYELSIDGILKEIEALGEDAKNSLVQNTASAEGYTNPTVRLVDSILVDAIQRGASDIHFNPEGQFVRLRYRIDGTLRLIRSFHKDYWMAIVVRTKIISDMNITETRRPQDGRITMNILGREISFRVATQPTIQGENIVLRVLDKQKALLPMEKLGYTRENKAILERCLKRPEGIVIVTGPTGSGKSTTLYSILSFINTMEVNIMTLEDPVEYSLPIIRQSNIKASSGMDFASGVKSLLRQDPDIIFVGEVRDKDTATMALRAAMTGHQVFTSLHTNDAIGAIPRLIDIGLSAKTLAGNIICIIAQRLARKLCNSCKQAYKPTQQDRKILRVPEDKEVTLYKHKGCEKCDHTGYKGRIAISEILAVDEALDDLIYKEASKGELLEKALAKGFRQMDEDAVIKVLEGTTDIDEAIRTINMTNRF